ncbi:MAG: hypothetical protein J6D03_00725 [Clostridia bacterium]|nr:hypothetical protein [Clostridia bacterium]
MKKLAVIFTIAILSIINACANNNVELSGSYSNGNIVYTFSNDSLYIDEVDIEGDAYTYKLVDNIVVATNSMDSISFNIKVNTNSIEITYDNKKTYVFDKVTNYDVANMKFVDKK